MAEPPPELENATTVVLILCAACRHCGTPVSIHRRIETQLCLCSGCHKVFWGHVNAAVQAQRTQISATVYPIQLSKEV